MPLTPTNEAGWRMEPPVSVPVAAGASPAATAAAEPPELPPGTASVSHGLRAGPKHEVSFDEPIANSSMLVLPSSTAPARSNCSITCASYGATNSERMREPQVVRQPFAQKRSLCAIGMPVSGAASPAAMRASAAFAWARLFSRSTVMKALRGLPTPSMRSRKWRVSSTLETFLSLRFRDNAANVSW
jgi:hypothetical protein